MKVKRKKLGVAVLIPDKIAFKTKAITRDKEGLNYLTSGYLSVEMQSIISKGHVCSLKHYLQ